VASDHVEVSIGVDDGDPFPDCNCSDQAVNETANGFSTAATAAVNRGSAQVVRGNAANHARAPEERLQLNMVGLISRSRKYFHQHRIRRRNIALNAVSHPSMGNGPRTSKKLDPG